MIIPNPFKSLPPYSSQPGRYLALGVIGSLFGGALLVAWIGGLL